MPHIKGNKLLLSKEFGPIFHYYIKNILESQLILDEDLEVLLSNYNYAFKFNYLEPNNIESYVKLTAFGVTAGAAVCFVNQSKSLMTLSILGASVGMLLYQSKKIIDRKCVVENIRKTIEGFKQIHRMNLSVMRYLKTRVDIRNAKPTGFFSVYTENIAELLEVVAEKQIDIFNQIKSDLKYFQAIFNTNCDDICFLQSLELNHFSKNEITDIESCIKYLQRLDDVFIFVVSKFLCYLACSFCSDFSEINPNNTKFILRTMLPNLITNLSDSLMNIKKKFDTTRYTTKTLEDHVSGRRNIQSKHVTTKLQQALVNSVTNISIIMEKAQIVLSQAESSADESKLKELSNAILDLRDHTFATYESLDVVCKLYGIIANKRLEATDNISKPHKLNVITKPSNTVTCEDTNDILEDQNFELYMIQDVADSQQDSGSCDETQAEPYLNLMLQELKQSLKQHQRFIAARKRRGSDDDDDDETVRALRQTKLETPARFQLEEVNKLREGGAVPPPLPLGSTQAFFNIDEGRINMKNMLDTIKAISGQRQVNEDVFGDEDEDSDDGDGGSSSG